MAKSKQNRKERPNVLVADACYPEIALKQVEIALKRTQLSRNVAHAVRQ